MELQTLAGAAHPGPGDDLSASLAAGWTLPATWYSDPGIHELEKERIFARAWQYVGRAEAVAEEGSFLAGRVGHIPVVVVRGRDAELRGFVNVCRHRAHLVADGEGCRSTLQCPYHAWTYDLDGSLLRAPRSDREAGFDPDAFAKHLKKQVFPHLSEKDQRDAARTLERLRTGGDEPPRERVLSFSAPIDSAKHLGRKE